MNNSKKVNGKWSKKDHKKVYSRSDKAITLIALIVTIIVLLILAGISISMLAGNNSILQRATDSKTETEKGEVYEQISLATASGEMEYYSNDTERLTAYKNALLNGVNGIDRDNLTDNGSNLISGTVTTKSGKQYDFLVPVPVTNITVAEHEEKIIEPTSVYAKLYDDGTLILCSTDYTDSSKTLTKDFGLVENKTEDNYWSASDYKNQVTKAIIYDEIVPTSTAYLFSKLRNLENIENISNLKTDFVTDMSYMFSGDTNITYGNHGSSTRNYYGKIQAIDLSDFNTEKVTNMQGMFQYQCNLTSLNFQGFDTRNVNNMSFMFEDCASLEFIQFGNFDTEKVTSFYNMFSNCYSIATLDLSSFSTSGLDQSSTYNSYEMFACRYSNPDNVIRFNGAVRGGTSRLEKIYVSDKWDSTKLKNSYMFLGCSSLVGQAGTVYASVGSPITSSYARVDGGPTNPGYFWLK